MNNPQFLQLLVEKGVADDQVVRQYANLFKGDAFAVLRQMVQVNPSQKKIIARL